MNKRTVTPTVFADGSGKGLRAAYLDGCQSLQKQYGRKGNLGPITLDRESKPNRRGIVKVTVKSKLTMAYSN